MTGCLGHRAALGLAVVLTACTGVTPPPPPPPPSITIPDLRGTWSGSWGGAPLTLLVTEQQEMDSASGVHLGSLQMFGERAPTLSGVMTSTIRGDAVSTSVQGWFGYLNGTLTLLVRGSTSDGPLELSLTRVEPERLAGTGSSSFRWGPRGHVDLIRRVGVGNRAGP
jgi:hypothetical protein